MGILSLVLRAPLWMKVGGIALLTLGVMEVRHRLEVRSLNGQIATVTAELVAEKSARVDLMGALSEVQQNRDTLALEVRRQNEAIMAVTVRAERAEAQAALRATRLLQQGKQLADALRTDTGPVRVAPGHEAMNAWLRGRLP